MYLGICLSYVFIAYRDVLNNDFLGNEVVVFNVFFVDVIFNFMIAVAWSKKYT